ncbi:MAG: spore germination protein [Candidatus Heteroscillospira sp.]
MSIIKKLFFRNEPPHHPRREPEYPGALTAANLAGVFNNCDDLESRVLTLGGVSSRQATLYYIDGVTSGADISKLVIAPLTDIFRLAAARDIPSCMRLTERGAVVSCTMRRRDSLDDAVSDLTQGYAVLVFDEEKAAISFESKTSSHRAISEPQSEKSVKGAKDSFVELLRINTSLVRRKLFTPALKVCQTTVGRKSHTTVAIVYLDGVADPRCCTELRRRIDAIDIDGFLTTACLEEYIVDHPYSPFPQLVHTERPDKFALNLLEGRVGILVDGIPLGFLAPVSLSQFMKVPEDNSHSYAAASLITCLRYMGLVITILLPAIYVAVALYHQEMIPSKLLISVIDSKQKVPFSTAVEILGMLVAFELLQEAGLRLPDPIGQTVSIIGALIVGQSAVEARVVSPIAVIVVALAGIAGYTCPSSDLGSALRIVRFSLVLAALLGGMFGLMCALALLLWHLAGIESLGLPYLSPLSEGRASALMKALLRPPLRWNKRRDAALHTPDKRSQK